MRFKNRYLCFQLTAEQRHRRDSNVAGGLVVAEHVTAAAVAQAVRIAVAEEFGDFGTGLSMATHAITCCYRNVYFAQNSQVKYFSPLTGVGILRVPRDLAREVWAAIVLLSELHSMNLNCRISVFHIAGTIKHAQISTIRHDKCILITMRSRLRLDDSKLELLIKKSASAINAVES
ncbi:hypothetical protein HK100_003887 [Physocladia obscura]|uniref:Ribonuclease P/MRP protein subunit POP5 n=1 Tax=Physocladia obscura TaxID=109957 RepID=A0AAD5T7C3_9FUNG|nr:hypothetical protein HK100_003887 [Physocladia obscura]